MSHRATSRDVARLADVSQSTVSYVLTGKGSISAETRDRVLRAAYELGYTPNLAARSMRTRRTGRVAVLMGLPTFNPAHLLAGAGSAARAAGYVMEVHSVDGPPASRTEQLRDITRSGQYEGVLALVPVSSREEGVSDTIPVVTTADFDEDMRSVGELADASPVAVLVEGLAAMGHHRFLHVAGARHYASAQRREEAYVAATEHLGLESLGVVGGDWTGAVGVAAVRALADSAPPIAVIAANDLVAIGVVRGATERGWSVPGDLSVTGWDNYEVGAYLCPTLTTVDGDRRAAGQRAMRRLIASLTGEAPPRDDSPLHHVIWRESTAPPRIPAQARIPAPEEPADGPSR